MAAERISNPLDRDRGAADAADYYAAGAGSGGEEGRGSGRLAASRIAACAWSEWEADCSHTLTLHLLPLLH
jgi:hypothetical protein